VAAQRITITVDEDVLNELKQRVGPGEVSAYVVEALRARLQRDPIMELLDKLDEMYGPLSDDDIEEGKREWAEMSRRLSSTLEQSSDLPEMTTD
jgi:Arc/MetJ family transcription regulator